MHQALAVGVDLANFGDLVQVVVVHFAHGAVGASYLFQVSCQVVVVPGDAALPVFDFLQSVHVIIAVVYLLAVGIGEGAEAVVCIVLILDPVATAVKISGESKIMKTWTLTPAMGPP